MNWLKITAILLVFSLAAGCIIGCNLLSPAVPSGTTGYSAQSSDITSTPTTAPHTQPSTEVPTEIPTEIPTEVPTQPPTEPPTAPPTEGPTQPSTEPLPPEPWSSQDVTIGQEIPGITAKKAFVFDCGSQEYLYMKSEYNAKIYPASITKLMNVYTALQYVELDDVITVDRGMVYLVPPDTSMAGLYEGDQLTVHNVILAALVASGSDAAHILGVYTGRIIANDPKLPAQEAENVFVEAMNRQAAEMGLINTHFVNCDGYTDYYHYTCMADLVVIAQRCLNTPTIRDIVRCAKVTLTYANGKTRQLVTTNYLLRDTSSFYRSEACGLKTGTTNAAGACVLSAFWVNDRYILIGVFQCPTYNSRYKNATKLFDLFKSHTPQEPAPSEPTEPVPEPTEPVPEPTIESVPVTT